MSELEFSGRTQRADEKNHFFITKMKPLRFQCSMSFPKHRNLFALEVFFALSCQGKQPCRMHHNTEALPLVYPAGDQGDFDVCHPITFLPRSRPSSSSSVVLLHCRCVMQLFTVCVIYGSEIYLSTFLSIGSIGTIYLYVLFILCQSVHLNYIVHMQTI